MRKQTRQLLYHFSDSGYKVCDIPDYHFYTGTKYAVTAITEGLRQEIRAMKSHIRISSISPGYVNTEFFQKQYSADEQKAKKVMEENPISTPESMNVGRPRRSTIFNADFQAQIQ
ncbi:Dehydrogenase/reductase SDR family member 11 [Armadillidium vulgare]|nr:Dehydrogenase/reductase SDR family member 11 [Armadillidium vulgare]